MWLDTLETGMDKTREISSRFIGFACNRRRIRTRSGTANAFPNRTKASS